MKGYTQVRRSNTECKRIDLLIFFKTLILQQLFKLSDEELEFQVNNRSPFEGFVGWLPDTRAKPVATERVSVDWVGRVS